MYIPIPITIINIATFTILVTLGTNVLARKLYCKDKHHSGMDIEQTITEIKGEVK